MSRPDLDPGLATAAAALPTEHPEAPDRGVRFRVLGSACLLALVAYLHRVGFATAAPELKGQTGLSVTDLGYLMATFMVAYGVVEVPFGVLGDRFGVRHLLPTLVVAWSVLTALIAGALWLPAGTAWPLAYLLVLRGLFGVFQGGMFPAVSRMLADWMPVDERGLAQGWIWTSSRLGGALAPLVVVRLFGYLGVGAAAFALLAGVGFVWCAGFWPWFRNTPGEMPGVTAAELRRISAGRPKSKQAHGHGPVPWGAMFRSRSAWCLCLTYGALGLTGNFFITMLPTYLQTARHLSPATAGWVSSVPLACGVVGCLLGGLASDRIIRRSGSRRWGRRLVGSFGLALGAVALAATLAAREPVALALLLGLAFFGNDLAMGPAWAAAADIGERSAGTLGGAMNMVGSFTGALGAVLAGRCLDRGAGVTLFVVLATSYAVGSLLWLGVDVTRPLVPHPPAGDPELA